MLTAKELSEQLGTDPRPEKASGLSGDIVLGRLLERERREYGLGQKEVASAVGIGRSHLAMMETGTAMPTIQKLAKLARFYNVSFDYLLGHLKEVEE